jgi:hypothetical protein
MRCRDYDAPCIESDRISNHPNESEARCYPHTLYDDDEHALRAHFSVNSTAVTRNSII